MSRIMCKAKPAYILGAFHLVTQVDTNSVFVTYWMPRKIERCLCRLVSLNGKHPL